MGFNGKEVEGQTWGQIVDGMIWPTAATIAREVFAGMIEHATDEPAVVNLNVPNRPLDRLTGWAEAAVGSEPPRRLTKGTLIPVDDESGADRAEGAGGDDAEAQTFRLQMDWGSGAELIPGTDGHYVANDTVSITWLGRLDGTVAPGPQGSAVAGRLDGLFPA